MANNIYDYSKLLGRLKEKNLTQDQLAAKIGISPASTNLKLCNKSPFKQDEILAICDVLDIDYSEIPAYFFEHYSICKVRKSVASRRQHEPINIAAGERYQNRVLVTGKEGRADPAPGEV